jgi:hypothetical protein
MRKKEYESKLWKARAEIKNLYKQVFELEKAWYDTRWQLLRVEIMWMIKCIHIIEDHKIAPKARKSLKNSEYAQRNF